MNQKGFILSLYKMQSIVIVFPTVGQAPHTKPPLEVVFLCLFAAQLRKTILPSPPLVEGFFILEIDAHDTGLTLCDLAAFTAFDNDQLASVSDPLSVAGSRLLASAARREREPNTGNV